MYARPDFVKLSGNSPSDITNRDKLTGMETFYWNKILSFYLRVSLRRLNLSHLLIILVSINICFSFLSMQGRHDILNSKQIDNDKFINI